MATEKTPFSGQNVPLTRTFDLVIHLNNYKMQGYKHNKHEDETSR